MPQRRVPQVPGEGCAGARAAFCQAERHLQRLGSRTEEAKMLFAFKRCFAGHEGLGKVEL